MSDLKDARVWGTEVLYEYGTGIDMIDPDTVLEITVGNFKVDKWVVDMNTMSKESMAELVELIKDSARLCMDEVYVGITKSDPNIVINREAAIVFTKCSDDVQDDSGFGAVVYKLGDIVFWITGIINRGGYEDTDDDELIEYTESMVVEKKMNK